MSRKKLISIFEIQEGIKWTPDDRQQTRQSLFLVTITSKKTASAALVKGNFKGEIIALSRETIVFRTKTTGFRKETVDFRRETIVFSREGVLLRMAKT